MVVGHASLDVNRAVVIMKHRITYIRDTAHDFDLKQLVLTHDSLQVKDLYAAKEHRLTIGLDQLPTELATVLEQSHELHLRWQSPRASAVASPYNSAISSGLHAFFTPLKDRAEPALCPALQRLFGIGLKCTTIHETFTSPPVLSKRFTSSASKQYYHLVRTLEHFAQYLQSEICKSEEDASCHELVLSLLQADSLDVDYDAITHVLNLSAYWSKPPIAESWMESIEQSEKKERVEVGILSTETATEEAELSLSGLLAVVGEDADLKPTMFSFPSRHHRVSSESSFQVDFEEPHGLHPTLRISLDEAHVTEPAHSSCSLHAYLTLPSHIFLDRHQFSDKLFLSSHNLASLRALSGATDLEAPDWVIPQWGSAALLQLASVSNSTNTIRGGKFEVTFPLHYRYLPPASGGQANVLLPDPVVFWACRAEQGTKMSVNPFDRRNLGYDGLFGDRTMFYHLSSHPRLSPMGETRYLNTTVPVLDGNHTRFVESGTVAVVIVGFAWLLWKLLRPVSGSTPRPTTKKVQ